MPNRIILIALACLGLSMSALAQPRTQGADPARVRAIIESCTPCHGADGIAKDTEVPHLAGQNEEYLQIQLENFRNGKRRHKEMRYVAGELTRAEMDAIAAYFAGLPRQ